MLLHSAILADTKVRHYPLVETFDAWEPWDVIHTAPDRLAVGNLGLSHASVKTPKGLGCRKALIFRGQTRGSACSSLKTFISLHPISTRQLWMPDHDRCLWPDHGLFAERHAMAGGPCDCGHDIKERIDDEVASVIKWPVPVLSVTRMEWLPQVKSDLFIVQTPSHLEAEQTAYLIGLIKKGQRIAIFGSPADGVDPRIGRPRRIERGKGTDRKQGQANGRDAE